MNFRYLLSTIVIFGCIVLTAHATCTDDIFLTVEDGEIAYAACPLSQDGYQFALCTDGVYGVANTTFCTEKQIELFSYGYEEITFYKGSSITPLTITTDGVFESYSVLPELPYGLSLDTTSGQISGKPLSSSEGADYVISGVASGHIFTTTLHITVETLVCPGIDSFPQANDGEYSYSATGCPVNYVGTAKRFCSGGHLGDLDVSECTHKPVTLMYDQTQVYAKRNSHVRITPTVSNADINDLTFMSTALPTGLQMTSKGTITGVLRASVGTSYFTVTASSYTPYISAQAIITITTQNADCTGLMTKEGQPTTIYHNNVIYYDCGDNYYGSWSYTCVNGVYDNKNTGSCMPKNPHINYPTATYDLVQGEYLNTGVPAIEGIVTVFEVSSNMPKELTLDPVTGIINGTITEITPSVTFTVTGKASLTSSSKNTFSITVSVSLPTCEPMGDFSRLEAGKATTFTCPEGYEGNMKRKCIQKGTKAYWDLPDQYCQEVQDYTFIIICGCVFVVCLIFLLVGVCVKQSRKRSKEVKSLKSSKVASSKSSAKGHPAKLAASTAKKIAI